MIGVGLAMRSAQRGGQQSVLVLGLSLLLAGCMGEGTGALGFLAAKSEDKTAQAGNSSKNALVKAPPKTAELASGKVVVQAPHGYCIDPGSMKTGFAGGFALIAACGNLPGGRASGADPVVMTVQVQPGLFRRDLPSAEAMATVLAPAKALHKVDGDGLTLVHLNAGGDGGLPKGDPKHWRGAMVINGYLVGLALYAPKGSAMAAGQGKGLILQLAENLLQASPIRDYSEDAAAIPTETPKQAETKSAKKKTGLRALFSKL
ncbi:hypothetical protein RXV86_18570 [Alisedimentitalea sp. MJ-SS2]|uniref:hypothetical protein n=1 Tax=Aliisedimentitalea sp. MJ-SS2 TaxID=3049795 RepID=UPI00290AAEAB|nr:hypothetical protein [Alisedimentitalea sp. MJ-SS2]MDU8929403.1 hypothetical protein [Alisedimentitalea sp. MJ-SS2]